MFIGTKTIFFSFQFLLLTFINIGFYLDKKKDKKWKNWEWLDKDDVNVKPVVTHENIMVKNVLLGLKKEINELYIMMIILLELVSLCIVKIILNWKDLMQEYFGCKLAMFYNKVHCYCATKTNDKWLNLLIFWLRELTTRKYIAILLLRQMTLFDKWKCLYSQSE